MGQTENDMVLGTGAYKRGVRATMFAWDDKGISLLPRRRRGRPRSSAPSTSTPSCAEAIAARARTLRENAGLLSGHALGEEPEADAAAAYDLLADILAVVPAEEPKAWNEVVVARLAELRPDVYGGMGRRAVDRRAQAVRHPHRPGLGHHRRRQRRQPARHRTRRPPQYRRAP